MHICRAGLHCTTLTGLTPEGRCLACRRESHRRAQAKYDRTPKGQAVDARYDESTKRLIVKGRYEDKDAVKAAKERHARLD